MLEATEDHDDADNDEPDDTSPRTSRLSVAQQGDEQLTAPSGLVEGLPARLRFESSAKESVPPQTDVAPQGVTQHLISTVPDDHELTGRYSLDVTGESSTGDAGDSGDHSGGAR